DAYQASTVGSSVLVKGGAIAAAGESLVQGTTTASGFISPSTTNCFTKPGFAYKYTQVIKVTDVVKPTVASGTDWTPATAAADVAAGINWNATKNSFSISGKLATPSCLAKLKLSFAASDACATNDLELEKTELLLNGTDVAATGTVVTGTAASTTDGLFTVELSGVPVGQYDLRVTVRDDCGNVTVSRLDVDVEDNKAPAPVCVQNLTATLMPNGTGGCMVVVKAIDVFQDINRDWDAEECTPTVKATIAKLTNGVEGAQEETLTLTGDDIGGVTARVYLTDGAGNSDFCTVTINVEDNFCGNGTASAAVAGAIQTESKATVEGVQVNLSGQSQKSFATGVNGLFVFNNLTAGADYTVTPSLNKGFLNGVSTFDLVLISKHILGVQPLNTPYKLIAADVNNSKSVTTLDLIQLRKLILNIDATFANNSSWRFVDASYTFPNASNPWAASFPEVKNVNDLEGSLSANFVAVKVGDVNGNAIANSTQGSVRNLTSNLGINVADMNMVAGNEYKVDFTAADLNGIEGFQFTLNLDKKGLELVDLVPGIAAEENFGIFAEEGVVTASWNGEAKGGVLFSLVVRAKSNTTLSEVLNLNSRYTAAEAYKGGEVVNVGLNFNASKASANYELYQNTPNPFAGESIIGFNLPAAGAATLTIQDVTGRTLKVINGQYAKGYNQVSLKSTELSATGVLTYTLKAADFTATRKMIIVE
ncbi:MAG: T9SS type A sorting domain-containing protein, partial [Saprospiraceae bacterium]|nr:T9SS type A sorting domain-containing protein [Saprospiraceae bacterium]